MVRDDVFNVFPEKLIIGVGVTCRIASIPGQNAGTIKYGGGGTLWVIGASQSSGCSFAVANQWPVGAAEILNMNLAGGLYLYVTGATTSVFMLRGKSQGFEA